jgi:hypothetical protein
MPAAHFEAFGDRSVLEVVEAITPAADIGTALGRVIAASKRDLRSRRPARAASCCGRTAISVLMGVAVGVA